jgi:hypothetical protein
VNGIAETRALHWAAIVTYGFLVAAGCNSPLGPNGQGIEGLLLIGPQCPVQSTQDPCPDLPYQATFEVRSRNGRPPTQVVSAQDGTFRVGLFPGFYTIHPAPGDPFPTAPDQEVVVLDNEFTHVTIHFDTGIR